MKDVADKTVADAGFQSENIVAHVVEGISNVLHSTDNDNEDNIIKMENETIQSTQMLPQLMQQMKQRKTLIAHIQTKLSNTNKNGVNDLVHPKMSPTLSFSRIHQKSFIYSRNRTNSR